ncbi:glycosyltransferase [Tenacibaculum dicentrarchi]|uniref:glycosyltransferase n=1 Tax=Tenacibaculum dicentrarchi TaxID=669041 RepID=UPI00351342EB
MSKLVVHVGESIEGGGAQSVLRSTIEILKNNKSNYSHKLICKSSLNYKELQDGYFPSKGKDNFLSNLFSYSNYKALKTYLKQTKPDIIHLHHYSNLSSLIFWAIYKYKKKNKVSVIHSVHTFEYLCSNHAGFDYKKNIKCLDCSKNTFKFKIFTRICSPKGFVHSYGKGVSSLMTSFFHSFKVVDYWTAPSIFLRKKMLNQKYIDENKIFVLNNPVLNLKKEDELQIKKSTEYFKFVYFGRFSEEKNIKCIIKAFHKISLLNDKLRLVLIGKGDSETELRDLVKELKIEKSVEFIGFLPKDNLDKELKKCHVSVLSSKCYETASMVVVESIQLNLVPIVCNHGGMKEMVGCCNVGLKFTDNDDNELSSKMLQVYDNYESYLEEVKQSNKNNLQQFSEMTYLENLMNLYSKV